MILSIYILFLVVFSIFSFGFVDKNLPISSNNTYLLLQSPLSKLIYDSRAWAGLIYIVLVLGLFLIYICLLRRKNINHLDKNLGKILVSTIVILFLAFPAFSYDIFNYMLTAKLTYFYKENPYLVMPIEIANEPWLAFTRAANKVALYGPTWISLTWVPFIIGHGSIPLTIYSFKLLIVFFYVMMLGFIYAITKNIKNVIFFGLNPLVLIEVLIGAHNDIVMMVFATIGLHLFFISSTKGKLFGFISFILSVFVKGATLVLLPIFFLKGKTERHRYSICFWLMVGVFLVSPYREEMYPWYAIWFLSFAALVPFSKGNIIHYLSLAGTFGLSFRHLPYILTREYGGFGPFLRIIFSITPVIILGIYILFKKIRGNSLLPHA